MKKIILWAVVIFIAFYLLTQPHGVQNVGGDLLGLLKNAGNALARFIHSL
jgi:hypothetical protein